MSIIPEKALNQHIAILGKTGSGKTFTAKGIVEHLLDKRCQVCVCDPTAAWWGLRLGSDGKSPGYDVVLLGGKHADIPLADRSGAAVARLVTQQRASVVIDTSGFTVGEYTRWFIDFAGTLYTTIRDPLHLVIDEAHYFMPQGGGGRLDVDAGKMLHAGNRLMSGGRSLGIRGVMITQRPAKLHKDALTCADTLIAMRVIAPQDRKAIQEWIDGCGDSAEGKRVTDSLASLNRGEGWVWYPEGDHLKRVTFPRISTYDSSATPKHGAKPPEVGEIKLDEVRAAMADAVKEAEANDPKKLRARIAELESSARKSQPAKFDTAAIERATTQAVAERDRFWQARFSALAYISRQHVEIVSKARGLLDQVHLNGEAEKVEPPTVKKAAQIIPENIRRATLPSPFCQPQSDRSPVHSGGCWRMLESLVARHPARFTEAQWATMSSLKRTGGTWSTYKSRLVTAGWVEREGDYWKASDAAVTEYGHVACARDRGDVVSEWKAKLGSGPSKMIDALLAGPLSRDDLAAACDLTANAGTFSTYLSRLRSNGLVTVNGGMVELTEELVG